MYYETRTGLRLVENPDSTKSRSRHSHLPLKKTGLVITKPGPVVQTGAPEATFSGGGGHFERAHFFCAIQYLLCDTMFANFLKYFFESY